MNTEQQTLQYILSDINYELTKDDEKTLLVNLAIKNQQELKLLRKDKYKIPTYKYKNEERLNPPSYQPTQNEIEIAMADYAMENEVWTLIYHLEMYINLLKGEPVKKLYTPEEVEKNAMKELAHWHEALKEWSDTNPLWYSLVGKEWFEQVYVQSLSSPHGGDCTAFPSTCDRCLAEGRFKLASTVTWGKSEGYKMEAEFFEDIKAKKA